MGLRQLEARNGMTTFPLLLRQVGGREGQLGGMKSGSRRQG